MRQILFFKILIFLLPFFLTQLDSFSDNGKMLTYLVDGKEYEGYYISSSTDAPTIIIIHDWDGLTDYEVKRANMLSEEGYNVFAIDLFGKGIRPVKLEDKREHTGELYKDREKMLSLIWGAMEEVKKQGASTENAVVMGYCFGGAAVLEFARSGAEMKGFVTFHGGLQTPKGQDYSKAKGFYLIFHGSADRMISMQDFLNLSAELEKNQLPNQMVAYGNTPHAFTVFETQSYRRKADENSWENFILFLNHIFEN